MAIILFHYGTQDHLFEQPRLPLDPQRVHSAIVKITIPSLLICPACHSPSVQRFAMYDCKNIVRIYDTSKNIGMTRNWSVKINSDVRLDLGTQSCYWLFDIYYSAQDSYEAAQKLLSINGKPKPNVRENICTIHIEGEDGLLHEPFFGSQQPATKLCQPVGILSKNYSNQVLLHHPLFSFELHQLLQGMKTPTEFWCYCYSQEVKEEILADTEKMKIVSKICQKLREMDLVDEVNNAAGLAFALIKLDLVEMFLTTLTQVSVV